MSNIIELKNICKSYAEKNIFNDYSLSIEQGDYLAVTGRSGAGKSTLLNMIGLLEKPDSGEIVICGYKNPELGTRNGTILLREKIGYLFQNYGLIDDYTVENNLKISARFKKWTPETMKIKIAEALEYVGLSNSEKSKIFQLSGGEQQRIAIAKILIKSPEIILADEPTGSLDSENRDIVMNLIDSMHKKGKTIILVTHDEKVKLCAEKNVKL